MSKKTKSRGNGDGSVFYNSKRKCWMHQKTLGIKKDGKYYRPTVTGKTKAESIDNMATLQSNILKDDELLNQLKNLILTPELKAQLQTLPNPRILNELHKKTIDVDLIKHTVSSGELKLSEVLLNIEDEKLKSNVITENTYTRNKCTIKHIEKSIIDIPLREIDANKIQMFLATKKHLSQSYIDKLTNLLNHAFEKAIANDIINKNPIKFVLKPISEKKVEEIVAFELKEQNRLIDYVLNNYLIANKNCTYDSNTIKNLILLGSITGMRLGELGAINYIEDIDFKKEQFKIGNSLTKNQNGKTIIGNHTKTGKKAIKQCKSDIKIIEFAVFDKEFLKTILYEQIKIAKSNPRNTKHLLFCNKYGECIGEPSINVIFKRICKEAQIKLELPKGCHFHMLRHTFATRCIEAGLELITIAKLMGHTTTKQIEKTYGHVLDKFRGEQLNKLNDYYRKENIIKFPKMQKLA